MSAKSVIASKQQNNSINEHMRYVSSYVYLYFSCLDLGSQPCLNVMKDYEQTVGSFRC